ncbi:DUF805 domain-containing protein [Rufibacter sediminis]|uniref:DUF805 domain-containing protein n=1 Tax=Rufibacter sediminis TaxID=2762756 RepID=A0ABR6VSG5_9BACT|nr:DUF805 domain-containing protein [Rufibacter sediminis]MBC3540140.1 DUF805 domain-containing protein [Rufibacter sediminis]
MFKAPFSFTGRIRRLEYGLSCLIYTALVMTFSVLATPNDVTSSLIILVIYIPLVWFIWAHGAKRCHDRGNMGWFQLIPFYGLVMLFGEGEDGRNRYGQDPKREIEAALEFWEEEPAV